MTSYCARRAASFATVKRAHSHRYLQQPLTGNRRVKARQLASLFENTNLAANDTTRCRGHWRQRG